MPTNIEAQIGKIITIYEHKVNLLEVQIANEKKAFKKEKDFISKINKNINSLSIPQKGTFLDIRRISALKDMELEYLRLQQEKLQSMQDKINSLILDMKNLHLKLEKMKYIQKSEKQKNLKAKKQKEMNKISEISTIAFNNQNRQKH